MLLFYQYRPRMEQDATRCIHREMLSINLEALVCKLVLAESPESKKHDMSKRCFHNESSLEEDTSLHAHLSLRFTWSCWYMCHCDSSYQIVCPPQTQPEIPALRDIKKGSCIVVWKTDSLSFQLGSSPQRQPFRRSLALFLFYQCLQRPFTSANWRPAFPLLWQEATSLSVMYHLEVIRHYRIQRFCTITLLWRLSTAPIHKTVLKTNQTALYNACCKADHPAQSIFLCNYYFLAWSYTIGSEKTE